MENSSAHHAVGSAAVLQPGNTHFDLNLSTPMCLCHLRIKYILRQSDIFATHFGVTLSDSEGDAEAEHPAKKAASGDADATPAGASPSKRRRAGADAEEPAEGDIAGSDAGPPTYLIQQPPSITGGTLRPYQLEGLNWMINLQAQGTNGEGVCAWRAS